MTDTLGTIGKELNIKFRQGSTFGPYLITLKQNDTLKTPINLTGYTFSARIKKSYTSPVVLANITVLPVDLVNGKISIGIDNNVTAIIKGNPNNEAEYVWDMEYTSPTGTTEPLFYGTVESYSNV